MLYLSDIFTRLCTHSSSLHLLNKFRSGLNNRFYLVYLSLKADPNLRDPLSQFPSSSTPPLMLRFLFNQIRSFSFTRSRLSLFNPKLKDCKTSVQRIFDKNFFFSFEWIILNLWSPKVPWGILILFCKRRIFGFIRS